MRSWRGGLLRKLREGSIKHLEILLALFEFSFRISHQTNLSDHYFHRSSYDPFFLVYFHTKYANNCRTREFFSVAAKGRFRKCRTKKQREDYRMQRKSLIVDVMYLIVTRYSMESCGCVGCGLPPEYCEFNEDFELCKPWIQKNMPDLYPDLAKRKTAWVSKGKGMIY